MAKQEDKIDIEIINSIEIDLENPLLSDEKFLSAFYKELSKVEGIDEYLRLTLLTDLKKYFQAGDEKMRDQIKGHVAFANALKKRIIDARK